MSQTCILTDSTAQFPIPAFPGRKLVSILAMEVSYNGTPSAEQNNLRANQLPTSAPYPFSSRVIPPTVQDFEKNFVHLGQYYQGIVALLHTSALSPAYYNARNAAANLEGQLDIEVIDCQTISTGLGLLVQMAAVAAEQGSTVHEISELIRSSLPRVYSLFCIPGLSYLHHSGFLGRAQAIVGEHLKMLPMYVLEEGQLVHTQKARNYRHLVDLLHEFVSEFEYLDHIGLIQGVPAFETETRALRERLVPNYTDTPISEHIISPELALMIGPRSLGLFVLQSE